MAAMATITTHGSRAAVSVAVAGGWGERYRVERAAEPAAVAGRKAAVRAATLQHGVDQPHQVRRVRAHPHRIAGVVQRAAHYLGLRVLGSQPGEDHVVAGHGRDPALLQLDHAIRDAGQGHHVQPPRQRAQYNLGGGAARRADSLAGQVLRFPHVRRDGYQDPLRRLQVRGGELHCPLPGAGDGEVVDHHVNLAAFDSGGPVGDVQHHELHLRRVAQQGGGDLVRQVDVGALQVSGGRVAVAGQVLARVHARDEPAPGGDGGQRGARWEGARGGQRPGRAEALPGLGAGRGRGCRAGGCAHRPGGGLRVGPEPAGGRGHQQAEQRKCNGYPEEQQRAADLDRVRALAPGHRYSRIRDARPAAAAAAAASANTVGPSAIPVSAPRAAPDSSTRPARWVVSALPSATSSRWKNTREPAGPVPISEATASVYRPPSSSSRSWRWACCQRRAWSRTWSIARAPFGPAAEAAVASNPPASLAPSTRVSWAVKPASEAVPPLRATSTRLSLLRACSTAARVPSRALAASPCRLAADNRESATAVTTTHHSSATTSRPAEATSPGLSTRFVLWRSRRAVPMRPARVAAPMSSTANGIAPPLPYAVASSAICWRRNCSTAGRMVSRISPDALPRYD